MKNFAPEIQIRDYYAKKLSDFRPNEQFLRKEAQYKFSKVRSDMRTVSSNNTIREWEFKHHAGHGALGQILTYISQARLELGTGKCIRGVIAAFSFADYLQKTITIERLHVELVTLPKWIENAGYVSDQPNEFSPVIIPKM